MERQIKFARPRSENVRQRALYVCAEDAGVDHEGEAEGPEGAPEDGVDDPTRRGHGPESREVVEAEEDPARRRDCTRPPQRCHLLGRGRRRRP